VSNIKNNATHTNVRTPRRGAGTKPKSYTLSFDTMVSIRKLTPEYGSQGRAIQVGSELLLRLSHPLAIPASDSSPDVRWTFKLPIRTIEIIGHLAQTEYASEGEVLEACIQALQMKKVPQRRRKQKGPVNQRVTMRPTAPPRRPGF
jgi:hypothetical protein